MRSDAAQIFQILDGEIPEAKTELEYGGSPFSLILSVILSARTTDVQVNKATNILFEVADSPQQILDLGYDKLCEYIQTIGLYKTKAKNILKTSEIIINQYNGQVPDSLEELMSLPGIGLKSANVILNILFAAPTIAVDTHVFRVGTRLELSDMKTRDKMSIDLEKELPKYLDHNMLQKAHHLMVLFGRYICKAKPKCESCFLYNMCHSPDKKPLE